MIFFFGETPDGWGIPGIHGMLAEDELDGYVQGAVYLIRGRNESLLIDSGNWTLPEFNNGMGEFLVNLLDKERNKLKSVNHCHSRQWIELARCQCVSPTGNQRGCRDRGCACEPEPATKRVNQIIRNS